MDLEELEFELIDAGLEEIEEVTEEDENGEEVISIHVYGDYTNFGPLQSALEGLSIDVKSANLKRFPNDTYRILRRTT